MEQCHETAEHEEVVRGTEITPSVRNMVYERDSYDDHPCCVWCGNPYVEVHHYIERSRGGKGIEENLVCLCKRCHARLHDTADEEIKGFIRDYLKEQYDGWNEEALIARKE